MITSTQIKNVVERIVQVSDPEKVILFGSYAYGRPTAGSDLDLLVIVKNDSEPRCRRARKLRRQLWGILDAPKDILVYTPGEIQEWQDVPQAFITTIAQKGEVVYEKQGGLSKILAG